MARQIVDGKAPDVPIEAAKIVGTLSRQALDTHIRLREIDRDLLVWLRSNDVARRLTTIPGIGPVGATALAASVTDPHQFRSGRQFAAWLGLTPLQKSSGGKERLGRITKRGDKYLRKLLIVGMTSLVRRAKYNPKMIDSRLSDLLARKPTRVAPVAMAIKTGSVSIGFAKIRPLIRLAAYRGTRRHNTSKIGVNAAVLRARHPCPSRVKLGPLRAQPLGPLCPLRTDIAHHTCHV
ncbi:transposase [Bradyrhizobium erythrophlei]|uniref:transposase n=1 Tax=Bradyrhizobium erythrophlei TaxID=1437360 RepID=UPI0018D321E3|nr:transposase [Bradyrhizobium erythrophlei]